MGSAPTLVTSTKLSYPLSPVSSEMGDRSRIHRLHVQPATRANSASYLQRDGKLVPAKTQWQCSVAGKVTAGLTSHRGRASHTLWYEYIHLMYGLNGLTKADEHPAYATLKPRLHNTTSCHTGLYNRFDKHGLTTGCIV